MVYNATEEGKQIKRNTCGIKLTENVHDKINCFRYTAHCGTLLINEPLSDFGVL
jgi:hypothetical protein